MTQGVKCLLSKHEILVLDPQNPPTAECDCTCPIPVPYGKMGVHRRENPGSHQPATLYTVANKRPCLKQARR